MKLPSIQTSSLLAAGFLLFSLQAAATQYPISSGTVTINGSSAALPTGGTFGNSTYDGGTGYLSAGKFAFPEATIDTDGTTITYQLVQTDTSSALVGSGGNVGFTTANMKLSIISALYNGFPVPVSPCTFSPIVWDSLGGTASGTGMQISNGNFEVPPTTDACGGLKDQINEALIGNENSISMTIDGNFTPPAQDDRIFASGFELQP